MSVTINGTSGLVFNDASTQNTAATGFGFKNRIINGAMQIDQRNAGASVAVTTASQYTLDRWAVASSTSFGGQLTAQRSTTAPTGFINSLGLTVTTADSSIGATEYYAAIHRIEGNNIADLGWGTANAQTVTMSFWVRSSLTGTFGGSLRNNDSNRSYVFTYTISAANTWEYKTITIAGDTTGTWLTDNGCGIDIFWSVGTGSTYRSSTVSSWQAGVFLAPSSQTQLISTSGATFYITGVQLEKGSTATSFDYRPYGTELALCQRYYWKGTAWGYAGTSQGSFVSFPVTLRASPTATGSTAGFSAQGATPNTITWYHTTAGLCTITADGVEL
jgi:hypothetical protein